MYMSYSSNIENLADTRQLESVADEPPQSNDYREAALRGLQVLTSSLDWIATNGSPRVATHAVALALGVDTICQGRSMSDIAQELGVTPAALSKQVKQFRSTIDIGDSSYVYHK